MNQQMLEHIPDSYKISTAAATPILSFFGVPIEQWVFVLSAILTILFIVEKIPKVIVSIKWMYRKVMREHDDSCE